MPTISIDLTVPQINRLKVAFGRPSQPATDTELLNRIKLILKRQVVDFEASAIRDKANNDVDKLEF